MGNCVICNSLLTGRQRKYCSRGCKNQSTNARHQSYIAQQRRGRERKLLLIQSKGSRCAECGYGRNHAALEFHHQRPEEKRFALDLRSLSNRRWAQIVAESKKCVLLCSNCHAEHHNPDCNMPLRARE